MLNSKQLITFEWPDNLFYSVIIPDSKFHIFISLPQPEAKIFPVWLKANAQQFSDYFNSLLINFRLVEGTELLITCINVFFNSITNSLDLLLNSFNFP